MFSTVLYVVHILTVCPYTRSSQVTSLCMLLCTLSNILQLSALTSCCTSLIPNTVYTCYCKQCKAEQWPGNECMCSLEGHWTQMTVKRGCDRLGTRLSWKICLDICMLMYTAYHNRYCSMGTHRVYEDLQFYLWCKYCICYYQLTDQPHTDWR